jgi:cbb3-type cytochrome oxidase subunit 3
MKSTRICALAHSAGNFMVALSSTMKWSQSEWESQTFWVRRLPISSQENEMTQIAIMIGEYWLYLGIPLVFLAIAAWVYRPNAKKRYEADGNIPFEGDKNDGKTK